MSYGELQDLWRRTNFDKVLRDKAFNIAKNSKYDGYQHGLSSVVTNFFIKMSAGTSTYAWKSKVSRRVTQAIY